MDVDVRRMGTYYPVMLDLAGKRCLVIGGGQVAERRVKGLLEAGASVRVVSPEVSERIAGWEAEGKLSVCRKPYEAEDGKDAFLVFAATDRPEVNEQAARDAAARGQLFNAADRAADRVQDRGLGRGDGRLRAEACGLGCGDGRLHAEAHDGAVHAADGVQPAAGGDPQAGTDRAQACGLGCEDGRLHAEAHDGAVHAADGVQPAASGDPQAGNLHSDVGLQEEVRYQPHQRPGTFLVPAVLRKGRLLIAVSTSGASPAAASGIRDRIGEMLGDEMAAYLDFAAEYRERALRVIPDEELRRKLLKDLFAEDAFDAVLSGDWSEWRETLIRRLEQHMAD
jgi:siroheme synthase (precorrin-2 oxidase/ferrochelatase)